MVGTSPYLSIGLASASTAACADPTAIPSAAVPGSLDAFAATDTACTAWSDGCTISRRRHEATFACSTPGIACQPSAVICQAPPPRSGTAH